MWIETSGDYTRLHTRGKACLCSLGIGALEERLDPARFLRVHRPAIVALAAIEQVASDGAGGFEATLCDRSKVRVSRSYAPRIRDLIPNPAELQSHTEAQRYRELRVFSLCLCASV